jgi:hypothetical protein
LIISDNIDVIRADLKEKEWRQSQIVGMGYLLADLYKAIEQSLRTIIEDVEGIKIIKNESWHQALLEYGIKLKLIPLDSQSVVRSMLKYRHRVIHCYGVDFREDIIRDSAPEAIDAFNACMDAMMNKYGITKEDLDTAIIERKKYKTSDKNS